MGKGKVAAGKTREKVIPKNIQELLDKGMTMSGARKAVKKIAYAKKHPHPNQTELMLKRFSTLTRVQPDEISRAVWDGQPDAEKSQHADGTCWFKKHRAKSYEWVPVYWRS